MKNLYTFVVEFEGGTYCSQFYEECETGALKLWLTNLYSKKLEIEFDIKCCENLNSLLINVEMPSVLDGLKNAWFSYLNLNSNEFYINIVKTELI